MRSNLIVNAFIDYNVYYMPQTSAIWDTFTEITPWRLALEHDYRSAITNPLLADSVAGDFHLQSTKGRYVDGVGWVADSEDSWAIDTGNPETFYEYEPQTNGDRINIGAYGGTIYASMGHTDTVVRTRILNEPTHIDESQSRFPLIWTAQDVPTDVVFSVQYSGDGGVTWVTLSNNVNPYQEYILWQTTPYWNTYKGYWRVLNADSNYMDTSEAPFNMFYGEFAISQIWREHGLNNIIWRGAWDEPYIVEYSTDMQSWTEAPTGSGPNQTNDFISTHGGDFTYEDIGSISPEYRFYRVRHPVQNGDIQDMYIIRSGELNTIRWYSDTAGMFMVEHSSNMIVWTEASSGTETNQQNPVINAGAGISSFEDIGSTNDFSRFYRVWRQE